MSFTNVVVGTDGSPSADKAVETAAALVRLSGGELHIVTAFHPSGGGLGAASGAALAETGASAAYQQEVARNVAEKAAANWGEGLRTHTYAEMRAPAEAIVTVAADRGADLIVVGSKGMRGARRVLGSVPNSVAHSAGCTVLVVKTD